MNLQNNFSGTALFLVELLHLLKLLIKGDVLLLVGIKFWILILCHNFFFFSEMVTHIFFKKLDVRGNFLVPLTTSHRVKQLVDSVEKLLVLIVDPVYTY